MSKFESLVGSFLTLDQPIYHDGNIEICERNPIKTLSNCQNVKIGRRGGLGSIN
jgi:hypothetical protein